MGSFKLIDDLKVKIDQDHQRTEPFISNRDLTMYCKT